MKQIGLILTFGLLASSLAGCHLPPPICETSRITYPEVYSPPSYRVIESLRPTVQWHYLDPTCIPENYHVKLQRDESDLYTYTHTDVILADETVPGYVNSWTPSFDLQPLQEYTYNIEIHYADGMLGSATTFFTGPSCLSKHLVPPRPRAPENDAVVYPHPTRGVILEWDYATDCWPDGYHLQVSSDPAFTRGASYQYEYIFERPYTEVEIFPSTILPSTGIPPCGTYYWHVASRLGAESGGEDSSYSTTRSFYLAGDECPLYPSTNLGPIPELIFFLVTTGAFCRSGPSTMYDTETTITQGTQLPVQGRNMDASWYYVLLPDSRACWISGVVGQLQGDPSLLTEIIPEPLPSPTLTPTALPVEEHPIDCSQYNANPTACNSAPACRWDSSVPPNGVCVNK